MLQEVETEELLLQETASASHGDWGPEVEFVYPPIAKLEALKDPALGDEFPFVIETVLPFLALPDRHDAFEAISQHDDEGKPQNCIYFTLPPFTEHSLRGLACFCQVEEDQIEGESAGHRGMIQKSVVLISRVPFLSYLESKLRTVAISYSLQTDHSSFDLLIDFYKSNNHAKIYAPFTDAELYLNLSVFDIVKLLGAHTLVLLRLLLIEGRVIFVASSPQIASHAVLAFVSLIPALLQYPYESPGLGVKGYRLARYGFPLHLFHKHCVLQPNFVAQQANLLSVPHIRGFLLGTCNPMLVKTSSSKLDAIVNLDEGVVRYMETAAVKLAKGYGNRSEAFINSVMNDLYDLTSEDSTVWKGSSTWIRAQFQEYFELFLEETAGAIARYSDQIGKSPTSASISSSAATSSTPETTKSSPKPPQQRPSWSLVSWIVSGLKEDKGFSTDWKLDDYNADWVHAWSTTLCHDRWKTLHGIDVKQKGRQGSESIVVSPNGNVEKQYSNGDRYIGACENGMRHGNGKFVEYATGMTYEGEWYKNERHGKGTLMSGLMDFMYDGDWVHNQRTGFGKFIYRHKESYTGHWKNDKYHGTGVLVDASGDSYDGEWVMGVREGIGALRMSNGDIYKGEFKSGKYWGIGTLLYHDGSEYSGQWEDGKIQGEGTLKDKIGNIYEGQWMEGMRHGMGILRLTNKDVREGLWELNRPNESHDWIITYGNNGDRYTGQVKSGRPWGFGTMKYSYRCIYVGYWKDGLRHGEGILMDAQGTKCEGLFENDQFVKECEAKGISMHNQVVPPVVFEEVDLNDHSPQSKLGKASLFRGPSGTGSADNTTGADVTYYQTEEGLFTMDKTLIRKARKGSPSYAAVAHNVFPALLPLDTYRIVFINGDQYIGEFKESLPHGKGKLVDAKTRSTYEGEFRHGKRWGRGILTSYSQDFVYDGEWVEGMRTGKGVCVISGRESYTGSWRENHFHGMGKYVDSEGNVYEGEFKLGLKHGVGKYCKVTGEVYSGEFKDGEQNGIGTCNYATGTVYSGSWVQGVRCGDGVLKSEDGETYEGQWYNDQRHGHGALVTKKGDRFEGEWTRDQRIGGSWTIHFATGNMFTGQWPTGHGVMKYRNNDVYSGDWVNGKRHGNGTCVFANGESFEGDWENDHIALDGSGKLILADGTIHEF